MLPHAAHPKLTCILVGFRATQLSAKKSAAVEQPAFIPAMVIRLFPRSLAPRAAHHRQSRPPFDRRSRPERHIRRARLRIATPREQRQQEPRKDLFQAKQVHRTSNPFYRPKSAQSEPSSPSRSRETRPRRTRAHRRKRISSALICSIFCSRKISSTETMSP